MAVQFAVEWLSSLVWNTQNDLPLLHKDPFDRILVAQARVEGLTLLTADKMVAKYGEGVKKV